MRNKIPFTVIVATVTLVISFIAMQQRDSKVISAASAQVIAPIPQSMEYKTSASLWWTACPKSKIVGTTNSYFHNYFQVPYAGMNTSGIPRLIVKGRNMDRVVGVTTNAPGYSVSLVSKSPTQVEIDMRANLSNGRYAEYPTPSATPWIWLNHAYGAVEYRIPNGMIPVYSYDNQGWGQCTWYAGIVARSQRGLSLVPSYSNGTAISANPNNAGFPKNNSVLMYFSGSGSSGSHMAFLETITQTGAVRNADGSSNITYTLTGSHYNAGCDAARSSFSTQMKIRQSGSSYSMVSAPVIAGKTVNRVAQ